MTNLTDKQKELLLSNKEDLKAIAKEFSRHWNIDRSLSDSKAFDKFASQFEEKKVRFTTNGDSEEVFKGDIYYCVDINKSPIRIFTQVCYGHDMEGESLEFTYFKSKEKAEEYVLMNSPKLSVNDVMELFFDKIGQLKIYRNDAIDKLTSLVKSKSK